MSEPQTTNPDQLPLLAGVPEDWNVIGASPGGPLQRLPFDLLLAKLIAADLVKADEATLQADLAHDEHSVALVHSDPDPLKNGWYRKTGASGAGNWVLFENLSSAILAAIEDSVDAVNAAAAAAEVAAADSKNAVVWLDHLGPITPVAGTAIGNKTVRLFRAEQYFTRFTADAVWRGAGPVKFIEYDPETDSKTDEVSVTVAAGRNAYPVPLAIHPGRWLCVYSNGLLDQTGASSPITPYQSITGEIAGGDAWAATVNQRVELALDFYGPAPQPESVPTKRMVFGKGYAEASLGTAFSNANTCYGMPLLYPEGWMRELAVYPDANGPMVARLYQIVAGKTDEYQAILVDASGGAVRLTDDPLRPVGERLPRNLKVRPNTIITWSCVATGGQISTTTTDGPNPAGENLIGALLPVDNHVTTPGYGLSAPAINSGDRLFAMEVVMDVIQQVNVGDVLVQETFDAANRPPQMIVGGGAWTFPGGKAVSAGTGQNSHLRTRISHCLDNSSRAAVVKAVDNTTIAVVGLRPVTGAYGSGIKIDWTTDTWQPGNIGGATAAFTAWGAPRAMPGGLDPADPPVCRMTKAGRVMAFSVETATGSDSFTYDLSAAQVPPLTSSPSDTLDDVGLMNGAMYVYALAGSVEWHELEDASPDLGAQLLGLADSIGDDSRMAQGNGHLRRLAAYRAARGRTTAIHAVDGANVIDMRQVAQRIVPLMPNLKQLLVCGGTNRASGSDDARDLNIFMAQSDAILQLADEYGLEAYWGVPAPHPFSPGASQQAAYLAHLKTRRWKLIRFDLALTLSDGVTIDGSLFWNNGVSDVHPILAGADKMFARYAINAPRLL